MDDQMIFIVALAIVILGGGVIVRRMDSLDRKGIKAFVADALCMLGWMLWCLAIAVVIVIIWRWAS